MSEAGARADRVGGALRALPLAIAQAAGYLAETGMPAGQYAALVGPRAAQLLGEGRPPSYPPSLAAVAVQAPGQLARGDPGPGGGDWGRRYLAPGTGARAQVPSAG